MLNTSQGLVIISDRVENREGINIFSNNLEFSSPKVFNALKEAAENLFDKVYYYNSPKEFLNNIRNHKDDIVLSTIWSGTDTRNRKIYVPAICEAYGIKYVGADSFAQALCADKSLCKKYCLPHGIHSPKDVVLRRNSKNYELLNFLQFPVVVKPNFEGSSIGISDNNLVYCKEDAENILDVLFKKYEEVLVEEYIEGTEISACIVGNNGQIKLFEIVKLLLDGKDYFTDQIWGYESKKGGKAHATREIITHMISNDMKQSFIELFNSLGKVDFMRIDGRIYNNNFYLIELTPDCSLHPDCFMYFAFKNNGYSFEDMIRILIENTEEYYLKEKA